MPSVSVIVPNYNHAAHLKERLDSILNQTAAFTELIILDDASRDSSLQIIRDHLRDIPHDCIINESNSGSTFHQWRKGVARSSAELIWIAESDDAADPSFLERCLALFERNPNLGMVFTNSRQIDAFGNPLGLTSDYLHLYLTGRPMATPFLLNGVDAINRHLIRRNIVMNASAAVFRRDLFLEHSHDLEKFRFSGDWLLWLRIAQVAQIGYISEPLNLFRQHGQKVTNTAACNGTLERENLRILQEMRTDTRIDPSGIAQSEQLILAELIHPKSPSGSALTTWQTLNLLLQLTRLQPRTPLHLLRLTLRERVTHPISNVFVSLRLRLGLGTHLRRWRRVRPEAMTSSETSRRR